MPELPDIAVYIEALSARVRGQTLEKVRLARPFLLRSVTPPLSEVEGKKVVAIRRLGKRIVIALEGDLFLVFHLMIAGRLHWRAPGGRLGRTGRPLLEVDFPAGTLVLTEAGTRRRAALHLVAGEQALQALDRGGLEILDSDLPAFRAALLRESHTLKRALTDPRLFSGVGNAYSDEILHRARLSPVRLTGSLAEEEIGRLHASARAVLARENFATNMSYVTDWAKYPELRWLNRFDTVVPILFAGLTFGMGEILETTAPGLGTNGPQLLVWGFFISTVLLFHGTATINSLDHMVGSRRYNTPDTSRNNALLALITLGEGWHNNHHHYALAARQGFFWWEIDITYYLLVLLSWLGIVRDLRPVPERARTSNLVRPVAAESRP